MKAKIFLPVISALLLLCGCQSDQYYQEQAAELAKKYLLENSRDLSSEQINHIRFNPPVVLHSPVLKSGTPIEIETAVSVEQHQICFAWLLPGRSDVMMVFGVSTGRMSDWYPNRIISRRFDHRNPPVIAAAEKCRDYAGQNLFNLMNIREINLVRFTFPYIIQSSFKLNINPDGNLSPEEVEELQKKYSEMNEYSVVWKLTGRNLVFSGYATDDFKNWDILFADFVNSEELKKCTVKELITPENPFAPFPVKQTAPAAVTSKNSNVENK